MNGNDIKKIIDSIASEHQRNKSFDVVRSDAYRILDEGYKEWGRGYALHRERNRSLMLQGVAAVLLALVSLTIVIKRHVDDSCQYVVCDKGIESEQVVKITDKLFKA